MARAYTYYVVATQFHGGGIISRHYSERAAEQAAARWRIRECVCGCCGVVAIADLAYLRGDEARLDGTTSPSELVR